MKNELLIATIGIAGVCVGSITNAVCQYFLQERPKRNADKNRKELLKLMLEEPGYKWRTLERLKHVIGADEETTKRLLLEIGARASENGKPIWGLIKRNPFVSKKE